MEEKNTSKNGTSGRPRKTESIKKRHIDVYLPNLVMVSEWKAAAEEARTSVSKFVVETMEEALRDEGKGPRYSKRDLINRNKFLELENERLKEEVTLKSRAYESLDRENRGLRLQVFQHPEESGLKKLDRDLIALFREKKKLLYDEILPELGIKPTDMGEVTSLQNELQLMMQFGLIKPEYHGWRWIE